MALICKVFWGLLFLIIQITASFLFFKNLTLSEILFFSGITIFYTLIVLLVENIVNNRFIAFVSNYIITILFVILPISLIGYYLKFSETISKEDLFAIFQTNYEEMIEFLSAYYGLNHLVLLLSILIILGLALSRKTQIQIEKRQFKKVSLFLLLSLVLISVFFSQVRLFHLITESHEEYSIELSKFRETQEKFKDLKFSAEKKEKGELFVVIIGESLNKNHMSLYGYHRKTTPNLDSLKEKDIIDVFTQAYSSQTHTVPVLTQALTRAATSNELNYYESPNIINVFNNAEFETYWLSNQIKYGIWDNPVTVISDASSYNYRFNKKIGKTTETNNFDEVVLPQLKRIIQDSDNNKNKIIFVHLMGNHFDYSERYPSSYEKYGTEENLKKTEFGSKKKLTWNVNTYDNSVVYNDYVVSKIFETIQEFEGPYGAIYFSDHSEDVITNHRHHSSNFDYAMVQIPLIGMFSRSYKEKYSNKYETIKSNKAKLFCNDFIYDFMIGVSNISTEQYSQKNDLSSIEYTHSIKEAEILKKRNVNDSTNFYYHREQNSEYLILNKEQNRIFPHRINSLGKASEAVNLGLNSIEIDVGIVKKSSGRFFLAVGHGKISGNTELMSVERILERLNLNSKTKIWLDIKNLTIKNVEHCNELLQEILIKYPSTYIVESTSTDNSLFYLSNRNLYTSYYLPNKIIKTTDENIRRKRSKEIIEFIKKSKVKAISFDKKLYPFVIKFIEPYISQNIHYHTWDLGLNFGTKGSIKHLKEEEYYKNKRVKTILIPFQSNFHY